METRSTTGCSTCKNRRKKCDETHPQCQRCTKSGTECGGYRYLKPKSGKSTRKKIASGPTPGSATQADQIPPALHSYGGAHTPDPLPSAPTTFDQTRPGSSSIPSRRINSDSGYLETLETQLRIHSLLTNPIGQEYNAASTLDCGAYTCWQTALVSHPDPNSIQLPARSYTPGPQNIVPTQPFRSLPMAKADAETRTSALSRQIGFHRDPQPLPPEALLLPQSSSSTSGSYWSLTAREEDESEMHDSEGVKELWISAPAMDSSVPSNLLAFVLQSYANWMVLTAFDPTRMVHRAKAALVQQIESSETARTRVYLISTAMGILNSVSLSDPKAGELISILAGSVHQAASSYKSNLLAHTPDVDRRKASSAFDNTLEIMALQAYAKPFSTILGLLESAAPAFCRACPGPPDTLVNLAEILLEPKLNLRHFAFFNVIIAVVTGRPMHFWYNVEFSIDFCDKISSMDKEYGLEWMHGTPDQFIVLFAWMNGLREDFRAGAGAVSVEVVDRIEQYLQDLAFAPSLSETPDPVLKVGRLAVQECWRQAAHVYLYMGLCEANNQDPLVAKAFQVFMRLINGVKPGRYPDGYLIIPWIILGMASTQTHDREIIRRRLTSRPECRNPAASGRDILRMLDDVWARSAAEGRPVVWDDLRVACFRITGM